MAYNSDGYIMIDFAEVDFSRTNQTIDGLFERCQKVIGTNKFVIVINANHKTPLPSTVCITNGQYVIESVLFTFSISSSDNLHITKKTTPEELIDDNHVTWKTTFSSNKIMSLLNGLVKSFTYVGTGSASHTKTLPEECKMIIAIYASGFDGGNYNMSKTDLIMLTGDTIYSRTWTYNSGTWNNTSNPIRTLYNPTTRELTMSSGTSNVYSCNVLDTTYTVYYI